MSQYLYGYLSRPRFLSERAGYKNVAWKIVLAAQSRGMYAHVAAITLPEENTRELMKRIGHGKYYDHMPFLLVSEPFDGESDELIDPTLIFTDGNLIYRRNLRLNLIGFCEELLRDCAGIVHLFCDSSYLRTTDTIKARTRDELASALKLLIPDTYMMNTGEIVIYRYTIDAD